MGSRKPSSLAPAGDPTSTLTFILASKFTPLKRHAVLLPPHHHEHLEGSFPRRLSQTILGTVTLLKLFKGIICPVCFPPALGHIPSRPGPVLHTSIARAPIRLELSLKIANRPEHPRPYNLYRRGNIQGVEPLDY